jgi:HptB-dependent secretion and biofilm anti anti-sigma factor
MAINAITEGTTCTIRVSGSFDFGARSDFRAAYTNAGKQRSFVVDLAGVSYVDSAALGMLLLLRDYAGASQVVLRGARAQPDQVLRIANFHKLFRME